MDDVVAEIATFATELDFDSIPEELRRATTTRIVDSIGCALPAMDVETVTAASRLYQEGSSRAVAGRVMGLSPSGHPLDLAGFMNTSMIRDLDFNDWSPNGHPSDCLGGILALSDMASLSGTDVVGAMILGYEIFMRFMDRSRMPYHGYDHGFAMGIATAGATGRLFGLSFDEIGEAISIVATATLPTRRTRLGDLGIWKGCATAFAVRNALFAVTLAKSGVTGPSAAFSGECGIFELITGPFELDFPTTWKDDFNITKSALKYWPFCYYSQVPAAAAMELRQLVPDWEELESVDVQSHRETLSVTADPEKWDPQTTETADHSTPYIVARLLQDGGVRPDAFEPSGFLDPTIRPFMQRISVSVSEEAAAAFPETIMATLVAKTKDGSSVVVEVKDPKGHPDNPLSEEELREKFTRLVSRVCPKRDLLDATFDAWSSIDQASTLDDALDLLSEIRAER